MTDKIELIYKQIEEIKSQYPSSAKTLHFELDNLLDYIESMQETPIILTEEILKKNGFNLYAPPRYKDAYWAKLFESSDGRDYYVIIYMEQQIETLMTIEQSATSDGKGHPTCYLPHPKTVQQLQNSLRLFKIKGIITT